MLPLFSSPLFVFELPLFPSPLRLLSPSLLPPPVFSLPLPPCDHSPPPRLFSSLPLPVSIADIADHAGLEVVQDPGADKVSERGVNRWSGEGLSLRLKLGWGVHLGLGGEPGEPGAGG